jgi:bifunctional DNase/RNase
MKNDVVSVQIRGILPANSGCALFVGNDEKVFVINVEPQMGAVIGMFLRQTPKERPLTHDLINRIFQGFGISVERVVITDLKNSTYFARLIFSSRMNCTRREKLSKWTHVRAIASPLPPRRKNRFLFPLRFSTRLKT